MHGMVALCFLLISAAAFAETVYLKDGKVMKGRVTSEDDKTIMLESSDSWQRIERNKIETIFYDAPLSQTAESARLHPEKPKTSSYKATINLISGSFSTGNENNDWDFQLPFPFDSGISLGALSGPGFCIDIKKVNWPAYLTARYQSAKYDRTDNVDNGSNGIQTGSVRMSAQAETIDLGVKWIFGETFRRSIDVGFSHLKANGTLSAKASYHPTTAPLSTEYFDYSITDSDSTLAAYIGGSVAYHFGEASLGLDGRFIQGCKVYMFNNSRSCNFNYIGFIGGYDF